MARQARRTFDHPHVFVTPFGVDERRFAPRSSERSGSLVVGTVNRVRRVYGIDLLLDAFALARQRLTHRLDLRLEITGAGPEEELLRRKAAELGLGDAAVSHGAVPHGRVPDMLQRLDIFVALSRHRELRRGRHRGGRVRQGDRSV